MGLSHNFDIEDAQRHGVDGAILINNFRFWILKNRANGKHEYDGRTWTYNSMAALAELFPYWTMSQIRRILKNLIKDGVLVSGNYNQNKYDRTLWYAFADESIYLPEKIHLCKRANGSEQTSEPIPDNKPDNKPDHKTHIDTPRFSARDYLTSRQVPPEIIRDWLAVRKAKKLPVTETALNRMEREANKSGLAFAEVVKICCEEGWAGFKAEWLDNGREDKNEPRTTEDWAGDFPVVTDDDIPDLPETSN